MAYPGNTELSSQAKDRVMTAFKQVVGKLQQGNREEALIGLEFVLRLDPAYAPAMSLHQQLSSGADEIDLSEIVSQLQAPSTDAINNLLVEAVEAFNNRDFEGARSRVEQVLVDLPGHKEARNSSDRSKRPPGVSLRWVSSWPRPAKPATGAIPRRRQTSS